MEDHPLQSFYQDIHSSYDRVNRVFTFGRDRVWRKKAARALLFSSPENILDLCTGTGDLILDVARMETGKQKAPSLTAYDFTAAMLQEAERKHAALSGQSAVLPVRFIEGDAASMPFGKGEFEALGISFGLRNLVWENSRADQHLAEIRRVLADEGRFVVLESSSPSSAFWRFFNNLYLRFLLPLIGGVLSGNRKAYAYLGKSSQKYYTRGQMEELLEGAGFKIVSARSFMLGSVMLVVAQKLVETEE